MSVINDYDDPEIRRRMTELEELTVAADKAWANTTLSHRARVARMRMISADMVVKLREIREYAISTNNWVEEKEENLEENT